MKFNLSSLSKVYNSVSSVEGRSNLLISLDKLLKLLVKVSVLLFQDANVLLESCDFSLNVSVSIEETGVAELNIIKLLSNDNNLVISGSVLAFKIKQKCAEFSVSLEFQVSLS